MSRTIAIPIQKPISIPKKDVVPNNFNQIDVQFIVTPFVFKAILHNVSHRLFSNSSLKSYKI